MFRRFGPFSRIGSLINVVVSAGISAASLMGADDAFECWGKAIWAIIILAIFIVTAVVVWARSILPLAVAGNPNEAVEGEGA